MNQTNIDTEFELASAERAFETLARMLVAYRTALVDAGMADALADLFTIHYHDMLQAKWMSPNLDREK